MEVAGRKGPVIWIPSTIRQVGATLRQRHVYHVLMWVLFTAFLVYIEQPVEDIRVYYALAASLLFYAAMVYFNINYLLPEYLNEKQFWVYLLLLGLAAMVLTPLRALALYWIFSDSPQLQRLLLDSQPTIFLSHIAVASGSTMLKIAGDWARSNRERQRLEAQNLQTELQFLRSQINPHFLFNTLNSLYALTLKKSEKAPETVLKLSDMMRYMLYESNARLVPLNKEIAYISNYLDLERLRHGSGADIRFEVEGVIDDHMIAPMLLITFVENSFKHGLGNRLGHGYVVLHISMDGHELDFYLENSKPEIPAEDKEAGGIGLINVRRRLELLYPGGHDLHITEGATTYTVNLHLNLHR